MKRVSFLTRSLGLVGAASMVGVLTFAASSDAATSRSESTSAVRASVADKDTHKISLSAGACTAGKESTVTVTVEAKGEYHINKAYPHKVKTKDTTGVTFTKSVVKAEDGKFDEKKGTLPIAFTAAAAGKVTIGGSVSVGVCRDEACVMDKVDLELEVDCK